MAENSGSKLIYGINIYHLKNQVIYYDWLDKTAYIIPNNQASNFTKWQLRTPVMGVIACIFVLLKANIFVILGLFVGATIVFEILFRKKYLVDLPISTKFERPKEKGLNKIAQFYPRESFKSLFLMFGVMAILMFLLAFVFNKYDGINATVSWIFIVITILLSIFTFLLMKAKDKAAK